MWGVSAYVCACVRERACGCVCVCVCVEGGGWWKEQNRIRGKKDERHRYIA